jgi:phosphatidate cytidylyltransferase
MNPPVASRGLTELHYRLITAAVGLPALALAVYAGGWPLAIVAGIVALLAAAEFVHGWLLPTMPLSAAWALAPMFGAAAIMVMGAHAAWQFVAVGGTFAAAALLIGLSRSNQFGPRRPYRVIGACLVYIGVLLSTIVLLRGLDYGREWVFLALLSTFAVDTGAFAVGKLIGRHTLAPRISPGKTWEGAVGGYLAGFGAVVGLDALFDPDVALGKIAILAAILPLAAISGDLLESLMKRRMGVKDASGLLPGHGGFLDRLDSILFTSPVVYVFVLLAVE